MALQCSSEDVCSTRRSFQFGSCAISRATATYISTLSKHGRSYYKRRKGVQLWPRGATSSQARSSDNSNLTNSKAIPVTYVVYNGKTKKIQQRSNKEFTASQTGTSRDHPSCSLVERPGCHSAQYVLIRLLIADSRRGTNIVAPFAASRHPSCLYAMAVSLH